MQVQFELQVLGGVQIHEQLSQKNRKYIAELKRITKNYGESTKQLVQFLSPFDTGYMSGKVKTVYHFSAEELYFETGWDANDFYGIGKEFYPFFQEFGTSKMRAQPSLNPAFNDQAPLYLADINRATAREWSQLEALGLT